MRARRLVVPRGRGRQPRVERQRRFWEHTIRDEQDFEAHMETIHYNPVKHGYVCCPHAWEWSSFHRWVRAGRYPADWACGCRQPCAAPAFEAISRSEGWWAPEYRCPPSNPADHRNRPNDEHHDHRQD